MSNPTGFRVDTNPFALTFLQSRPKMWDGKQSLQKDTGLPLWSVDLLATPVEGMAELPSGWPRPEVWEVTVAHGHRPDFQNLKTVKVEGLRAQAWVSAKGTFGVSLTAESITDQVLKAPAQQKPADPFKMASAA